MDTEKARVFLTIVNEGSLSSAAEKLGYTCSGISRSLSVLEEELGVRLFTRGKKGVHATAEAEEVLPVMRELVHQDDRLREISARLKGMQEGSVTIGISYAGYFRIIADPLRTFTGKYPGIRIRTLQATSTELLSAIEKHEVDLAVMTCRESELNFLTLREDPMVACLPENYPIGEKTAFPLRKFEEEPFIAPFPNRETDYSRAFENTGVRPDIQYTTQDIYAAYCMVEAGLGVSMLNRLEVEAWQGRVKMLKTDPEVLLKIGVMYPDRGNMTLAASAFLDHLTGGEELS